MNPVTAFTVDRATWLHGENRDTFLKRRDDGKKCCLGFLALACGIPEEAITGVRVLKHLDEPDRMKLPVQLHPQYLSALMELNDEQLIAYGLPSDTEREARLTRMFSTAGIDVTFTGSY